MLTLPPNVRSDSHGKEPDAGYRGSRGVYLTRQGPARFVGTVEASDADAAIAVAPETRNISSPIARSHGRPYRGLRFNGFLGGTSSGIGRSRKFSRASEILGFGR